MKFYCFFLFDGLLFSEEGALRSGVRSDTLLKINRGTLFIRSITIYQLNFWDIELVSYVAEGVVNQFLLLC